MKLYFANSQIPELAGLTRPQRKAVYQCALETLLAERPSAVWDGAPWVFGGILSGVLAGWLVVTSNHLSHLFLVVTAAGLAGVLVGIFIGTQILTARLRPYFRRVLEERQDEIAQIN